jgi:hypothetical protein
VNRERQRLLKRGVIEMASNWITFLPMTGIYLWMKKSIAYRFSFPSLFLEIHFSHFQIFFCTYILFLFIPSLFPLYSLCIHLYSLYSLYSYVLLLFLFTPLYSFLFLFILFIPLYPLPILIKYKSDMDWAWGNNLGTHE